MRFDGPRDHEAQAGVAGTHVECSAQVHERRAGVAVEQRSPSTLLVAADELFLRYATRVFGAQVYVGERDADDGRDRELAAVASDELAGAVTQRCRAGGDR